MTLGVSCTRVAAGFRHEALLYEGEDGFLAAIAPLLREALAAEAAIMVAVSAHRIARLRDALGEEAAAIAFVDMADLGRNPARIIGAWQDFVLHEGPVGAPLFGVGEPIWAERCASELAECHRHEALLNVAFAEAPDFRLVCPYDVAALDRATIAEAQRTHPCVLDERGAHASPAFPGVEELAGPFDAPLASPPPMAETVPFDLDALGAVRACVAGRAEAAGLAPERRDDLVLAVNEVTTNSVRHGGGRGTLRLWREDDALICEVRDRGRIADPLVGRRRGAGPTGGYGLWLVNQVCDLVELRTGQDGTAVRMRIGSSRRP